MLRSRQALSLSSCGVEDEPYRDKVVIEGLPARHPAQHRLQQRGFAELYFFLVQDFHHLRLLAARRRRYMPEDIAMRMFLFSP